MYSNYLRVARANIKGSKKFPTISGIVTFQEVKEGVMLTAKINGLPHSKDKCKGRFFGFHIHERNFLQW